MDEVMAVSGTADLQARLGRLEIYLRDDADNLNLLGESADLALQLGKFANARARAERALTLAPGDPGFRFRLASICIAERRLDEAEKILGTLREGGVDLAIVSYNLAYTYVLQGRHGDAIAVLGEALGQSGCPSEAETLLMRALHGAGRVDEALEVARKRLEAAPEDSQAMGVASLLYLDKGDLSEAERLSAGALRKEPANMEALVTSGSVALAKADRDTAQRRFERAIVVNSRDGRAWSGLALTSMFSLDLPRSLAEFRKAVSYMPDHIGTWHALAWCQILMKDLAGAAATFERALSMNRNFAESHGGRAVVAALQGRTQVARESVAVALRLDPNCLSARYAEAILSGSIRDAASFQRFAEGLLKGRRTATGGDMRGMLARFQRTTGRNKPPPR